MRRKQLVANVSILVTVAAILVLVAYQRRLHLAASCLIRRQNGTAASSTQARCMEIQPSGSLSIVRIVHQSWKTRRLPTSRAKKWSDSWKTCFPDWEWRLWTDEDNLALVRDHYPWFLPVYLRFRHPVERADVARYFYMFHYGGIYTDLDTICLRNFSHLLQLATLVFGGMENDGDDGVLHSLVQNSFMASQRNGHQFWMRLVKRIERNIRAGKTGRPEDLTGPNVLMEELREYVKSNASDVKIFPGKYFNPFSWKVNKNPACKDFGQMSESDERTCIASFPEAYVAQLHTQSWGRGHFR